MKTLDEVVVQAITDMIIGRYKGYDYDGEHHLVTFLRRSDIKLDRQGASFLIGDPFDVLPKLFVGKDAEKMLLRLASPKEYAGDHLKHGDTVQQLNNILWAEDLTIEMLGATPMLKEITQVNGDTQSESTNRETASPIIAVATVEEPDFSSLNVNSQLLKILATRWYESQWCMQSGAHLAAIIMMGSLLEGILIARCERDPAQANQANATPKDNTGKPKKFREWGLSNLIDVAHEINWIERDAKDFSHILRQYRNMVHPTEQRERPIEPNGGTCRICWEVVRNAVDDLLQ